MQLNCPVSRSDLPYDRRGNLSARQKAIIRKTLQQNGRCFWCDKFMLLPTEIGYQKSGGRVHSNGATIDHLYPRHHPLRTPKGAYRNVAACWKCNQRRATVEETHRRAGTLGTRIYRPNGEEYAPPIQKPTYCGDCRKPKHYCGCALEAKL